MMKDTSYKRCKEIFSVLVISLMLLLGYNFSVKAETRDSNEGKKIEVDNYNTFIELFVEPIFEDREIAKCEYLYNLDDSADYVYIEFVDQGYAVYAKDTMELLEYSLQGISPYKFSNSKKYYAGPSNYLHKNKNHFFDINSGEKLNIEEKDIKSVSKKFRENINKSNRTEYNIQIYDYSDKSNTMQDKISEMKFSAKKKDDENLIVASTTSGYLIPNYGYFITRPTIGENYDEEKYGNGNSGTCGPIAAQLILGYHNYYSDRRIIEDRFLNGYDDETGTVTVPSRNPNYCYDPMLMSSFTLGTRSEATGTNSFYNEMITKIMQPNASSSNIYEVKEGIEKYLKERLSATEYKVAYKVNSSAFSAIDSSFIKSELDAGRPVIINMSVLLGATNHYVVGYGYQDYTYSDESGTFEGYVVHYGWQGAEKNCVWINSAWCYGYVSLKINHTHNYIAFGTITGTDRTEYRCSSCGHRTDAAINMTARDRYVERVATIPQNEYTYKDYYVTFDTAGYKLFQTFGNKDVKLFLYDTEYNELANNDDSGHSLNAMFNYKVEKSKPYILRVKFFSNSTTGNVKIGITPASETYSTYEKILTFKNKQVSLSFTTTLNTTKVITFTPTESGTYTIKTLYAGETKLDSYLYFIDPSTTSLCLYNDDGAGNLQASITSNLIANKTYFIVVSTYDITSQKGTIRLDIRKAS